MSTPVTPKVALYYDSAWQDITGYTYTRDRIQITRGRANEGNTVEPSTCALTVDNRDGRFSPRNPTGSLYGKIGRNTPLRVQASMAGSATSLLLPGGSVNSKATTPDTAALDLVGDLDLRAEFVLDSFAATACLFSKGTRLVDLAYELLIGFTAGVPHVTLRFSTTGTDEQAVSHDLPELNPGQPIAVRATLDVNNGGGNHEFTFYTAPTIAGPFVQHGTSTVVAGTVTVASTAGVLSVGQDPSGVDQFIGNVRAVRVLPLGGALVARPNFNTQAAGTTSFVDAAGLTWTVAAAASIGVEPVTRFTGEVSAWPQTWDVTGRDVYVPVQAAGIQRRLGQGQQARRTGLTTFVTDAAFDQCWQGDISTSLSALRTPLTLNFCAPYVHYGQGDFGPGQPSGMFIDKTNTVTGNVYPATGYISGYLGANTGGTFEAGGFVFKSSQMGTMAFYLTAYGSLGPGGYVILFDAAATTATIYKIVYDPDIGYTLTLIGASIAGQQLFTDGATHSLLWTIVDVGATLTHTLYIDGVSIATGSDALASLQGMSKFWLTYDPTTVSGGTGIAVSFITFWSDQYGNQTLPDPVEWALVADGYTGETAGNRISRLCSENDLNFISSGDLDDTVTMGPQGLGTLLQTLQDAANTDLGVLYEPRDSLGLNYRTRVDFYNQTAEVTLIYPDNVLGSPPQAVDDDQNIHNDVTVSRTGGASVQDVLEEGPLSVQAPPDGINTYSTSVTANVETDAMLPDQASWRLTLGTLDEARYPSIVLNMLTPAVSSDSALLVDIAAMDVTDRITVQDLPSWLPPDDVDLLVLGYTETIDQTSWVIEANCVPESPYHVGTYATSTSVGETHFDAEDSVLDSAMTTSQTTMTVRAVAGQPWTTDTNAMPFDINVGGERMTVTGVAGNGYPAFIGVGTAVSGNNASVTPNLPASVVSGNRVYIFASIRNTGAGTVNTPTNWTTEATNTAGNAKLMSRLYDGVWTMPTVTFTGGVANADTIGQSFGFGRVAVGLTGSTTGQTNGSAQDIGYPAKTDDAGLSYMIMCAWKQDDWTSVTEPSPWTEIQEKATTAGDDAAQVVAYVPDSTAAETISVTGGAAAVSSVLFERIYGIQTLTVTRSVNGVVKTHAAGDSVALWTTPRFAL